MLTQMIDSWTALFSNHALLRTGIDFFHIGGLVVGGGCAVTADLATITASRRGSAAREVQLQLLERTHVLVVCGLTAVTISGVLLFAADVETFLYSPVFWLKMGLLGLLIANGVLLLQGERRVRGGAPQAWTRLHVAAVSSLSLWLLTTLAGAALSNLG